MGFVELMLMSQMPVLEIKSDLTLHSLSLY